jgi:lycopene cyclase domain-containing protein
VNAVYLILLIAATGCMMLVDLRFRLFFWRAPRRAAAVVGIGLGFFLAWDLQGIALGIFRRGVDSGSTGVLLAPQLPLEELFFLLFLCYLTAVLAIGIRRMLDRRKAAR